MTKNIFIVAIAVLLSVAFCSLSAQNVSKDYNVGDFSAINLQSVGNIIFYCCPIKLDNNKNSVLDC